MRNLYSKARFGGGPTVTTSSKFYQSLCQIFPNGLLSIDGTEITLFLDDGPYKFKVEASLDVFSNLFTAFSVSDTETSEAAINVPEERRKKYHHARMLENERLENEKRLT